MAGGFRHLRIEERPGYWIVVLDCVATTPNRLRRDVLAEVQALVEAMERRTDIAAVIVTGAEGKGFLAGADLGEVHRLTPQQAFAFSRHGQDVFGRLARARPLVIAAIDGYCIGGGLDLALACDLRYATTRSVFAHPGTRLGLLTGWGGTARLPREIGRAEALRLFLTAERMSAADALRVGLLHGIVEGDVLALACQKAEAAARRGPEVIARMKEMVREATDLRRGRGDARGVRAWGGEVWDRDPLMVRSGDSLRSSRTPREGVDVLRAPFVNGGRELWDDDMRV